MVMHALGEPEQLQLTELPDREPSEGEVGVEVEAIGCNFADILICRGTYQWKPEHPFVPGSEIAGRVSALGPGVSAPALGQRVVAQVGLGGYASRVVVSAQRVRVLPASMPGADACALGVAYQTAYLGLFDRAQLAEGETLLVHAAAGGVGLAAVQLGCALGARVIAGAGSDDKLALCLKHGAHEAVNTRSEGWDERVRELTGGRGADVVYESVGGEVFERSLKCIAWGGRLLVIGFSSGEIPSVKLNRVLLKHISIVGLNLGGYGQHAPQIAAKSAARLYELYEQGSVKPVIHGRYPLAEAARALRELGDRRSVGKVILEP
jgi:NADPH2:quinone reductase